MPTANGTVTPKLDESVTPEFEVKKDAGDAQKESLSRRIKKKLVENKEKRLATKDKDKKDYNKVNIKSRARLTLIIATLVFLFSVAVKTGSLYIFENEKVLTAIDIIGSLAESVSGIILGLSIGNMSLDFFSYADYMRERIEEVIIKKNFLKTISDKEKRNIIEMLESSLYFNDQPVDVNSLYYNIKNKIVPLRQYYERSFTHIDCRIEDGFIYKTLYNTLVIKTEEEETYYKLPFSVAFNKNNINQKKEAYNITRVMVNGEPVEILKKHLVCDKTRDNVHVYSFEYPLTLKKGINTIQYVSNSIVNIQDNTYTRTVVVPCKNCVVEMSLQNEDYEILGQGFAIEKEKNLDIQYYNKACRIEFRDWIIPGDGCIFIINKKIS